MPIPRTALPIFGLFLPLVLLAGRVGPLPPGANGNVLEGPAVRAVVEFQRELDALRAEFGFPGATAAFVLPDGTVGTAATGLADVERGFPMAAESRMLAASIGKSFVAATTLALAGEGRLGLDDPLSTWLGGRPWFNRLPNHTSITLRHLLTHTSGLPDHVHSPAFMAAWARRVAGAGEVLPPDSLVAYILDGNPLFPPGGGWSYADTGYILLGLVIEAASGADLFGEIDRRFLGPLALTHTSPSDRVDLPGLAAGYISPDNPFGLPRKTTVAPGVMAWDPGVEWAGGGLVSTPRDLVVWARELFEGRAMQQPYLEDLLDAVPIDPLSSELAYGAGVAIRLGGPLGPTWGHSGSIPGYTSSMRYYPDHRIAVAFQVNGPATAGTDAGNVSATMEIRLARMIVDGTGG